MVERGQDSSTSHQHSPQLQAGVSASPIPRNVGQPHSCRRNKPALVIYKLLLRCFQTLLHFYLCEWPEKRNSGADSHAERWNWPSLASSSSPLTQWRPRYAAPSACTQLWFTSSYTGPLEVSKCFIITIYLFPSVHECLKEEIQTSPNQIQLQKETKILIQFSIWPWTRVLTTLSSNTAPNLTTTETLLLSHWTAFPSAASQLCPAICCCFWHPHSKSLHTSLFVGSSHHTPD